MFQCYIYSTRAFTQWLSVLQVGMRACYVQRKAHESYPEFLDQPELVVRSFEELAEALLGLSSEELEVGEGE